MAQQKMVRHPGDVIADHAMARLALGQLGIVLGHAVRVLHEKTKERVERSHGTLAVFDDGRMRIEPRVAETASALAFCSRHGGENPASRFGCRRTSSTVSTPLATTCARVFSIRSVARWSRMRFSASLNFSLCAPLRMAAVHFRISRIENRHFGAQLLEIEQARLEAVVEVGRVVGDLVHQVDQLRFERRAFVEQIFGQLRKFGRGSNRANA